MSGGYPVLCQRPGHVVPRAVEVRLQRLCNKGVISITLDLFSQREHVQHRPGLNRPDSIGKPVAQSELRRC